jgi:aspartate/methionine/tyrosine aminotransferase
VAFSSRLDHIAPFQVVEVLTRAKALEAEGRHICHLEAGEPDFASADPIIKAGQAALSAGATYYSQATGLPALKQALVRHYESYYGVSIDERRILITPGASAALMMVAALLMDEGKTLLMTDPGYPCNKNFLRLFGGDGRMVPVGPEQRYQLNAQLAEEYWDDSVQGALVASPANPTGQMIEPDALKDLYDVVRRKGGSLIVDEIYHCLTFGFEAKTALELGDDVFVINSFSKYFGMTGWRLGWCIVPEAAVDALERLAQNLFISMSTMGQYAALAAFEPETLEILEQRREIFNERRKFLLPAVRELGFDIPLDPVGALYLYADASRFTTDSQAFCMRLLEEHGVALTPGTDFGQHRANEHIRFSYTTSMDELQRAVDILARALPTVAD